MSTTISYIAAVFATEAQAENARGALLALQGSSRIEDDQLYDRRADGDLMLDDVNGRASPLTGLIAALPGSPAQEALEELNAALPPDCYVVFARAFEEDAEAIDAAVGANGGTIWRKTAAELQAAADRRFSDSASM